MREWVYIIFIVSLAGGIINILAASTKSEKYVKFLCGLCCMLAVISPLKKLISAFEKDTLTANNEISVPDGNEYIREKTVQQTKEYVSDYLYGKTGIKCRDISIEITVTDTETVIGAVTVFVEEKDLPAAKAALDGIAEVVSDG